MISQKSDKALSSNFDFSASRKSLKHCTLDSWKKCNSNRKQELLKQA